MKFSKDKVEEQLKVCKKLKKNLNEFETLSKNIDYIFCRSYWNGIPMGILNEVTNKYEFGDLIITDGEIYYIKERLPQSQYEHNIGVKNYIAQRVKWDLGVEPHEYDIEEDMEFDSDGTYDFSTYIIRLRDRKE